ncbi:MAG: hypothetical protein IPJ79_08880 [Bacteroidetes bacterium]|nr:hypothetical protein [Bacteroidota bacterium]
MRTANKYIHGCPVANATGYTEYIKYWWWLSPTIVSGQGTNTVSISYPSGFIAAFIVVQANNCAGSSGFRFYYSLGVLVLPPIYTGSNNPTQGVCAGSTQTYEIIKFPNASSYRWSAPAGAVISNGLGLTGNPLVVDSNIAKVYITYPSGFTSGTVSVYASNACGNSPTASLNITSLPTGSIGSISGPTTNLCGGSAKVYSVGAVSGATSYTWTVPTGATISGSTTGTSISVNFGAGFIGTGNITVKANNACGSTPVSSLALNSALPAPGAISGPTTNLCGKNGQTYSIAAVTGATSYTWTVPSGATFTMASNGRSISVNYGSGVHKHW